MALILLLYYHLEIVIITIILQDPSRPKYEWMAKHTENETGTNRQYVPYSTVPSKIQAWVPPKKN